MECRTSSLHLLRELLYSLSPGYYSVSVVQNFLPLVGFAELTRVQYLLGTFAHLSAFPLSTSRLLSVTHLFSEKPSRLFIPIPIPLFSHPPHNQPCTSCEAPPLYHDGVLPIVAELSLSLLHYCTITQRWPPSYPSAGPL